MSPKDAIANGKKLVLARSKKVKEDDIQNLVKQEDAILRKAKSGSLSKMFTDVRDMFSMASDYRKGKYTTVPFGTIAAIVAALLYVVNPLDFIPDFLPMVGLIDDATAVAACLSLVRLDISKYRKWRSEQEK